jgi:hypothetical protein
MHIIRKSKNKGEGGVSKNGSLAPFFELTPKTMLVSMPSNYTPKKWKHFFRY